MVKYTISRPVLPVNCHFFTPERPLSPVWAGARGANPRDKFSTNTSCKRGFYFQQVENPVEKVKNSRFNAPLRCGIQLFPPSFPLLLSAPRRAGGYILYFSRWKADYFRARNLAAFAKNAHIAPADVVYC
ncbi:MAG TPA: hypothetical protein H9703_01565 [Candidatus Faecalibacterium faecigallinarum]|uniref:Uncharacterized protein n=1 Tax=Candidatus Faecalibacterium faecigallinarum TaxID=2838577 RepID=A0A9D2T474_9FIRM|nr:hypothetical protein [Candidatus Faecalibacterium faecigallinarum]